MERILYYSTNRKLEQGFTKKVTFKEALFMGLAPDNGLFMPTEIPKLSKEEILKLKNKHYHEIAHNILKLFLKNEINDDDLKQITKDAYNFEVPIEKLDNLTYIVRLDHGPTASFKDFAARLMARAMQKLKPKDKQITILVATSGDTGSAVGEAYRSLEGIKVYIFYPENEVSNIQKKQLDSIGKNVKAIAINGKFDDCQKLVKEAFSDPELKKLNLTSANSINIGRILPQIVYYFYSYLNVADDFEEILFSIPSGNFGNSLGCEIARRMGLPVKLLLAVNENDEFPKFLETKEYKKIEPSRHCLSNAMNVGNPSNLARYFELYNGTIDKEGIVHKMPDIEEMKKFIDSVSISDEETIKTIKEIYEKYKIIIEPHGAVGIAALSKYFEKNKKTKSICLETADPAKFPEIIRKELNIEPKVPEILRKINKREGNPVYLPNSYEKVKDCLVKNADK